MGKPITYEFRHIDVVKYCGASGDFNPIHTVAHIAKEEGYTDVIVPGLMTMGMISQWIEEKMGFMGISNLKIRFLSPVYPQENLFINFSNEGSEFQYNVENEEGTKKAAGSFVKK